MFGLIVSAVLAATALVLSAAPVSAQDATQLVSKNIYVNSIGMEFIYISSGTFVMGSNDFFRIERGEGPERKVKISSPFYLGKYEVTQSEWISVMGSHPPSSEDKANFHPLYFKGKRNPVTWISWNEANIFIERLNKLENCQYYRLPTEAEWEYAARAGKLSYELSNIEDFAWVLRNSGDKPFLLPFSIRSTSQFWRDAWENNPRPHPVGQKKPNRWGLHDMFGNVMEWVQDNYAPYPKASEILVDPKGPPEESGKIARGCAFNQLAEAPDPFLNKCHPSERHGSAWSVFAGSPDIGFRIVRTIK